VQDETQPQQPASGGPPASQPAAAPQPAAESAPAASPAPAAEGPPEPHDLESLRVQRETAPIGSLYPQEHVEPMYLPLALSVGAGFKFGCGFLLATGMAAAALLLLFSVIFFVATLMGIPLPLGPAVGP